jgi:hypothetical protein
MRSPASSLLLVLFFLAAPAYADQTAMQTVQARVQFQSRTSFTVSSDVLHFDHDDPLRPTVLTLDFTARARTDASSEVVLTVELVRAVEGPGGAADVDAALSFNGEGEGTRAGSLSGVPSIAGRWTGSGAHTGQLSFTLRTGARGHYTVPLRFVLTAP